ncbi:putative phosphoglycerate dehydrogenase [Actinobaculum sp. oral taxon 183 str. F0552]|jgi:phosphoglycerate dehydrogenase|uniref:phosphoglycerate dehydrogenase n=1 Tax=Actinobaculum sp. oral taxon 183 TaxID=712888 RepID=UPI0003978C3A|nr:phosphoglycerate dehydrogenase [Actinobaculum sp. oral taxon 183]ERH15050.1 putative phosphoglycerate dehydrogenase [Actinobaculum sp. oral taxon 183 str. F0552]
MARALLLESPHESADEVFARVGIDVVRAPGALQGAELVDALRGVDILGIRSKTSLTREVLEASAHLTAIGAYCIGTNQIDLATASRLGIAVFNAPYANTRSVVELAIAEAIALTRRLPEKNAALQAGVWAKSAEGAHEVRGKTLGIVGYGSIGTQLSVLAEALGMHVIFHDVAERLAIGNAARVRSLSQLLAASDIVSIHVDGRPSNKGFFGKDRIAEMKRGAILINLSRGSVVDVDALRERLADGSLGGAAIDVFPREPDANGERFSSPLAGLPNVILTPHIGGSTIEAQESIGAFVSDKLTSYWRKGLTDMSVNIPCIDASPDSTTRHRVAWIHSNTPGALALVNAVFADAGANIDAQTLATTGDVGYMVTDISSPLPSSALTELEALPHSIRIRVLHRDS